MSQQLTYMRWHMGLILISDIGEDTRLYERNRININITEWLEQVNMEQGKTERAGTSIYPF